MLEAKGLMVFYENMLALNNVHIRCKEKEIVGVFGANSAGKSTLMYTISGIMEDIRKKELMAGGERITVLGNITYMGENIMGLKPSRRARKGIVLCPERRRIFSESSVLENLRIGGYLAAPSQAKETLDYVFRLFPALERLKKRIGGFLSGGEQQALTVGRTLMGNPDLLLLDEPVEGLAPIVVKDLGKQILKLGKMGETMLFSEQNIKFAMMTAERAYVIDKGRIRYQGRIEELSANEEVKKRYLMI